MASSLFSRSCRSSSTQILNSYSKFSPIISSSYSYSQNLKPPIVSSLLLLSNRSFSHDHDHKKLLNPTTTTSTWSFSDSTALSKFLASTQEKLSNPNPSFITSSSTCNYPLNKNMPKTYTNYISSNWLSNPCRNLGLRSFSTSSSDKPAPVDIELVANVAQQQVEVELEGEHVANEMQQLQVKFVAKELQQVVPELLTNGRKLSSALTPLCVFLLCNGGWVSYLSLGAFAFPLWVASSLLGIFGAANQIKLSFEDKPNPFQILNRELLAVLRC